jgi:hypothetical protein
MWYDHQAVTAIATASVAAANGLRRRCQSRTDPMPATAPTAGASATV